VAVERDAGGTHEGMVDIPGGPSVIGTDEHAWVYDNERPRHEVDVAPFRIDSTPVTNRQYRAFVEDGGYDDARLWSAAGWDWHQDAGVEAPLFWRREGGSDWSRRRYGRREELPLDEAVQHICWHEADAFATWRSARLPTEAEWETAAARDGEPGAPQQMVGNVWEWTATDFAGYPGFVSFPYREYSEVFFGPEYKVLRGGSWASDASVRRATWRTRPPRASRRAGRARRAAAPRGGRTDGVTSRRPPRAARTAAPRLPRPGAIPTPRRSRAVRRRSRRARRTRGIGGS